MVSCDLPRQSVLYYFLHAFLCNLFFGNADVGMIYRKNGSAKCIRCLLSQISLDCDKHKRMIYVEKRRKNIGQYAIIYVLSNRYPTTGGSVQMEVILSFLVTVIGGVVCHFIVKWPDSNDKNNKQPSGSFQRFIFCLNKAPYHVIVINTKGTTATYDTLWVQGGLTKIRNRKSTLLLGQSLGVVFLCIATYKT